MHEIRCAEIWGGTRTIHTEVCTSTLTAAIASNTHEGDAGGDIYYFSVCAYDKLTRIAIADLRGHGADANLLSSWLYDALEERMNSLDGAGILSQLNTIVREKGFQAITTAAIATYYRDVGKLYFSYAGHPPMIIRPQGNVWRTLPLDQAPGVANLPLGIVSAVRYDQAEISIQPGDRISLFTDGVLERMNASGEIFGEDRLRDALEASGSRELGASLQQVLDNLDAHGQPDDDSTLMIVEVR
jgi:sigma-B regulation protein RsbU (phosphoserine phosphatase)